MVSPVAQEVELSKAFSFAIELHSLGHLDRATKLYEKILASYPNNPDASHLLGLASLQSGNAALAINLISKAISINPTSAEYYNHLAAAHQSLGETEKVIAVLKQGLSHTQQHPILLESLANQCLMQGDIPAALQHLHDALRKDPNNPLLILSLARAHARHGDAREAMAAFQLALANGGIDIDICLEVVECLASVGYTDQAKELLNHAKLMAPHDDRPPRRLAKLVQMAYQFDEAIVTLIEAVKQQGETLPLLIDLGSAYLQRGLLGAATGTYFDALQLAPDNTEILNSLALALGELRRFDEAIDICSRLIKLRPGDHSPQLTLAGIYLAQKNYSPAIDSYRKAQYLINNKILDFDHQQRSIESLSVVEMMTRWDYLKALANVSSELLSALLTSERYDAISTLVDECVTILRAMAEWCGLLSKRIAQANPEAGTTLAKELMFHREQLGHLLYNRGIALLGLDQKLAALHAIRASIEFSDNNITMLHGIGVTLTGSGAPEEGMKAFQKILTIDPENALAFNSIGLNYLIQHMPKIAEENLDRAYELDSKSEAIRLHLAWAKQDCGKITTARRILEDLVTDFPNFDAAWGNLGIVNQELGRFDDFIRCNRKVLELNPERHGTHSSFLFGYQYIPTITVDDIKHELMEWGRQHAAPHYHKFKPLTNDPDPNRKIRVGFVSADFKGHSATYFTGHLFRNFNREKFEIYSYAEILNPDGWTEFFRQNSDVFYLTPAYNDDQMADLIRRDKIDILIDLSGHTAGSRLTVFARKPAPIQVSWIGIGNTTGVLTMDYFLTDWHFVPEGYDHLFCEKPWRLPSNLYCYEAMNIMPDVGPLPALKNGYLTFGSFSRAVRFNVDVRRAWAELMLATPDSRLFLNTRSLCDPEYREVFYQDFEKFGIHRDRLRLEYVTPTQASWAAYNEVDIALDPFPHNAGLTTCEALWMGVPVLSVLDRPPQGRYGASMLTAAGLPDFVAQDVPDMVRIGAGWHNRMDELATLRAGLREQVRTSRLCDGVAYTRDFENALIGMWQEWCKNPVVSIPADDGSKKDDQ